MSEQGAGSVSISPMAAITAKLDSGEVSGMPVDGVKDFDSSQAEASDAPVAAEQGQGHVVDAPDPVQEEQPGVAAAASSAPDTNPVPYKRFHGVIQERNSAREQIKMLKEQLAAAQSAAEKPAWLDSFRAQQSQANQQRYSAESDSEFFDNLFSGGEQSYGDSQSPANSPQISGMMNKMMQRLEQLEAQNKDFLQDRKDREYGRHIGQLRQNNQHVPEDLLVQLAVAGVSKDALQEIAVGLQGHIHGLMNPAQEAAATVAESAPVPPAAPRPASAPSAKTTQNEGRPDAKAMQDDRERRKWLKSIAEGMPGGLFGT